VDLARFDLELDTVQGAYARKGLDHVDEPQHDLGAGLSAGPFVGVGVGAGRLLLRRLCSASLQGAGTVGGGHDACSNATSLARTAAPVTPARAPSSDRTTGRLPVASGSERR
jgi:hypothetical protein